ncbi:2-C-methyl-D-erythritol 4-phosphate cytidylyltransferase, partial [Halomonas sp. SIMBA_159]
LLCHAIEQAQRLGTVVTDDASAIEALDEAPRLVKGRRDNLKVTPPDDLALAAAILAAQAATASNRRS